MTNCTEAYECYKSKADKEKQDKQQKDFEEMAKVVEKYMQNYCHPHITIIATLDGIEVVEGIKAKRFEVLD